MLTAGFGIWAVSSLSKVIPHSADTVAWVAAVALMTAGVCCGVLMIAVLLGSGGARRVAEPGDPSWAGARGPAPLPPGAYQPGPPSVPRPPPGGPRFTPDHGPAPEGWPVPAPQPEPAGWLPPDDGWQPDDGWPPGTGLPPGTGWHPDARLPVDAGLPDDRWQLDTGLPLDAGWPPDAGAVDIGPVPGPGLDVPPVPDAETGPGGGPVPDVWSTPESGFALPTEPGGEPVLDLWPTPDEAPDDGPPHRVESAFDVWQRESPAAEPGTDPAPAVPGPPDGAQAASAWPAAEWVVRDPAPRPDAGLLPPADEPSAEPALPAQADHVPAWPKASRGSRPTTGWNPDSEEDWLRVLRGLRASEDDR
ncbi:MAG TPA: hypothetical protein VMH35_20790 [Streptosporangiaceae bacterium]|nr:hypothetical protein [Streptosporangiaceae bacterium]